MIDVILKILALLAVVLGTLFSLAGVIGFIRLPDVYTRLHATGKVSVFGVVLLMIAAVFVMAVGIAKGLVLIVLLVLSGPVLSHCIASAAYRIGIPMTSVRDDLADHVRAEPPDPAPAPPTDQG